MLGPLLKRARECSGLTQSKIAQRAATSQPSYNAIENGTRVPRVDTAIRALESVGLNLAVFPSVRTNTFQIGQAIAQALDQHSNDLALRLLIQLADNLRSAEPAEAVGLTLTEPVQLRESRWANALTGIVEHCLISRNLPVPQWTQEYVYPLANPVHYDVFEGWVSASGEEAGEVPEPLRKRGILLEESEFVSA